MQVTLEEKLSKNHAKQAYQKNHTQYTLRTETLTQALINRSSNPGRFLIFLDGKNNETPITGADALAGALATAQYLVSRGLKKNDKVVVMLPTSFDFVKTYFGILFAGGIPVPVTQPAGTNNIEKYLDNLKHIISNSDANFFITYDKIKIIVASLLGNSGIKEFIFASEINENPVQKENYKELPVIDTDDIALIQYTSGTTGKPKGVLLSHKNLLHNVHGICIAGRMTDKDVGISWLPLYHDMGLIGTLFTSLYWDWSLYLMQPEIFLLKPIWWFENIGKYGVTMTVAPNFGYHYCTTRISEADLSKLNLKSWRFALNGAEPIDKLTIKKFIDKFKVCGLREDVFWPVYGMAENSLAATFPDPDMPTVSKRFIRERLEVDGIAEETDSNDSKYYIDLVSVGYPLIGQEVKIVDAESNTLNEGIIGEIIISSPSLSLGYYKNEKASAEAIRDGWLYTGDMGFIVDGQLFVSGRSKEMIIKRGKNIYPYDVERIASAVPGVRLGCTAAFAIPNEASGTEDLVLVCETKTKDKEKMDRIRKEIIKELMTRLNITPDVVELVPRGTIPKTSSGKTQRVLVKKNYLDNNLVPSKNRNYLILARTMLLSYFQLFILKMSKSS